MAIILCIETATTNCSVAIYNSEKLVGFREDYNSTYSHAESLHVFIKEVLEEIRLKFEEIDAIAVSKGPGSYTGLRIGVSAAKGLCYALDIPLIAIETLTSLAHQIKYPEGCVIPLLDARRMEVYTATFDKDHQQMNNTEAKILESDAFSAELEAGIVDFVGNGVAKFSAICTATNARFFPDLLPSAKELGPLALEKYKTQKFEDVAYFEPYYLKDFVAGKPKK